MIEKTVRGGYDTYVDAAKPSKTFPKAAYLALKTAAQQVFLYLNNPVPKGAIVVSAKLQLRARGASSGSRTITAQRASKKWTPAKVNWNNKPPAFLGATSVAVGALSDGQLIELDVTSHLQTITDGAVHHGWWITTSAGSTHKLYGLDAGSRRPVLVVKWTWRPPAPTGLTSAGGVSVAKPLLQFVFNDVAGAIDLAAVRVQIDPAGNGSAPAWDSGEKTTTVPELDLAGTSYPGLAVGASTMWRVQVKSGDGYWSPWSTWVSFSRIAKGTMVINAPGAAPLDLVTESTPPFLWSFTDQVAYQVTITTEDRLKVLHDTRKQPGADQAWTPPAKVITKVGGRYSVRVRGWDNQPRITTPNDPAYSEAWRDFTFAYDSTEDPVSSLSAEQVQELPCVELRFQRATPPDAWAIERNGQVIATDIDPADLMVAPGRYRYRDWTAPAFTRHVYKAVPIVNGKSAAGGPLAGAYLRIRGVWVVDPVNEWRFNLLEVTGKPFSHGEDSSVDAKFDHVARKILSVRGLEGAPDGVLVAESEADPRPLAEQLVDVYAIKERPLRTYRVALVDVNFPAEIGNVDPAPSSEFLEGIEQRACSFQAWQNGELPFKMQA